MKCREWKEKIKCEIDMKKLQEKIKDNWVEIEGKQIVGSKVGMRTNRWRQWGPIWVA